MSGSKDAYTYPSGGNYSWRRVTRRQKCQICNHDSWCSISSNGAFAICCRESAGSVKTKESSDGTTYHIHVLDPDAEPFERPEGPDRSTSADRAEPEVLDRAYRILLSELQLSDKHRDLLVKRGFTSDEIKARGYKSFPLENRYRIAQSMAEKLGEAVSHTIPGMRVSEKDGRTYWMLCGAVGITIPMHASTGEIIALKVRRDDAEGDEGFPRYTYISSKSYGGPGAINAVHSPVSDALRDVVRVTEGEFKADITTVLSGVYTMSFPGVGSCQRTIPVMCGLGTVKRVLVAFDADFRSKKEVALAMVDFCRRLDAAQGVEWAIETWSPLLGAKGIDDVWAMGFQDQVKVLEGGPAIALLDELETKFRPKPTRRDIAKIEKAQIAEEKKKTTVALNATAMVEFQQHVTNSKPATKFVPLSRGDHPELAARTLRDIRKDSPVEMVYDREVFHRYNASTGLFEEVPKRDFYIAVSMYAGSPVGPEEKQLCLKASDVKGTIDIASQYANRPYFFNNSATGITFRNGFVTVENGQIKMVPHSADQRSLTSMEYDYVAGAKSAAWEMFLDSVFANTDPEDRAARKALLQEHIGACMVGIATKYAVALILTGKGNNGKSVYIKTIRGLFPAAAVKSLPPQMWSNRFHLAGLAGIRLNAVSELPYRQIVDSDEIKAVVSGDETEVAHKRGHPFELVPIAGHVFGCNKLPETMDQSDGFWRRFTVVVFDRKFTNSDRIIGLSDKLRDELPAIAVWALEGAARLQRNGEYTMPPSSKKAKTAWQNDSDQVRQWVAQCTRTEVEDQVEIDQLTKAIADGDVPPSDVLSTAARIEQLEVFLMSVGVKRTSAYTTAGRSSYDSYKTWSQQSGHATLSEQKFLTRLGDLIEKSFTKTGNVYPLRLIELPSRSGEYSRPVSRGSYLPS